MNDELVPRLKFIAKLNKGDKINVKNMYIQQNNLIDKVSRTLFHVDDRSNTLLFVAETMRLGLEMLSTYLLSHEPYFVSQAKNLATDLRAAKKGLLNLKETYADDVMFTCKIDTLIEECEARLDDLHAKQDIKSGSL